MSLESQESVEDSAKKSVSRGTDFKLAMLLLLTSSVLIYHTLGFPMSGSYGGVENQWYVSPALFPLILLFVLFACSISLLVASVKAAGHKTFFKLGGWVGHLGQKEARNKWVVILLLGVYVYIYIPSIDFYLATSLFVFSLVVRFYYDKDDLSIEENVNLLDMDIDEISPRAIKKNDRLVRHLQFKAAFPSILLFFSHILLIILITIFKSKMQPESGLFDLTPVFNETLILYSDMAAGLICIVFFFAFHIQRKHDIREYGISFVTAFLVPLLLIIIFNFFLYVPMPVEYGSVMNFLNYIAYDVLGAG